MRFKPKMGQILIEISWGRLPEWAGTRGTVNMTQLARKCNTRPVRLVEYLRELNTLGYISDLSIDYKTIHYTIRQVGEKPVIGNTSRWNR